jgi:hypothetical protein
VTRRAVAESVALALACLASFSLVRYASGGIHSLSHADHLVAGLWAVIATAFVVRTSKDESIGAAKTRLAATALSFAFCFVYLLVLPFHAWGMALLIAAVAVVLSSLGLEGDIGVAAITTAAVMVIAALGPHDAWKQPLVGAVATAVGIAIGLAAATAEVSLVPGHRAAARAR